MAAKSPCKTPKTKTFKISVHLAGARPPPGFTRQKTVFGWRRKVFRHISLLSFIIPNGPLQKQSYGRSPITATRAKGRRSQKVIMRYGDEVAPIWMQKLPAYFSPMDEAFLRLLPPSFPWGDSPPLWETR